MLSLTSLGSLFDLNTASVVVDPLLGLERQRALTLQQGIAQLTAFAGLAFVDIRIVDVGVEVDEAAVGTLGIDVSHQFAFAVVQGFDFDALATHRVVVAALAAVTEPDRTDNRDDTL